MGEKTGIEWTDATWNPVTGCTKVSPGCANCYIERTPPFRIGHRKFDEKGTTGVQLHPDRLEQPLRWRKPRRVFVNSLSDLFHDAIPFEYIDKVFRTMQMARQHTYQVLTKRPSRMQEFLTKHVSVRWGGFQWPEGAKHIWLGVSVENQHFADERIPLLLQTPAGVRFISAEPLLSQVRLKWEWVSRGKPLGGGPQINLREPWKQFEPTPALDWVICGGESGPGARTMNPDWARLLRDQCQYAGVKFFFKQWGEFSPNVLGINDSYPPTRIGKKAAGRNLDGREWNELPVLA